MLFSVNIRVWIPRFCSALTPFLFLAVSLATVWLYSSSQMRGKRSHTKLHNTQEGFHFFQTGFYSLCCLFGWIVGVVFALWTPLCISPFHPPHLLLERIFCSTSTLAHIPLVAVRCSVVRFFCLCKNPHQRLHRSPFKRPYRDQK